MKYFLLDYGGESDDSLIGKDLMLTDAPDHILELASEETYKFKEKHHCASELFMEYIKMCGYWAKPILNLEELPIYGAHNPEF